MKTNLLKTALLSASLLSPFLAFAAAPACTINSFTSLPSSVNSGQSSTLSIRTSGCDKVVLYGIDADNETQGLSIEENGSVASGPVTATHNIFTIQASSEKSAAVSQSLIVGLNIVEPIAIESRGFVENLASVFTAIGAFFTAIFH